MKTIAIVKTKVEIANNVYATKTHWEEITVIDFFKGDENAPKEPCKDPKKTQSEAKPIEGW